MVFRIVPLLLLLSISPLPGQEATLLLKSFPPEARLFRGRELLEPESQRVGEDGGVWRSYSLSAGYQVLSLRAPGYQEKRFHLRPRGAVRIDEKLERGEGTLRLLGEYPTGRQPKGVAFAPDGETMVVTNLDGPGVDLFGTDPLTRLGSLEIPDSPGRGYVEALYLPGRGELLVSQMSEERIHLFALPEYRHIGTIPSGGGWPKVMVADSREARAYVSNWLDRSIGVIDLSRRELIRRIDVPGIPRGMAVSPDDRTLYVALFDRGDLLELSLEAGEERSRLIEVGDGALRHLLLSRDGGRLYISDMYHGEILVYDTDLREVIARRKLGYNLNTIALTPGEEYLVVSERGRNSPGGYMTEGPHFGRLMLCDPQTLEVVSWVWGRNQPTGLAVSPDGTLVAFTDFLDDNLEVYRLTPRD
ncbi:MAG: hypothetical protein ACOC45_06760 [Alkalispirochaetaceae bacterium]